MTNMLKDSDHKRREKDLRASDTIVNILEVKIAAKVAEKSCNKDGTDCTTQEAPRGNIVQRCSRRNG